MTSRDVVERLAGVERAELGWRALLAELHTMEADGTLTQAKVVSMQARLTQVAHQVALHGEKSKQVVKRCLKIQACPGPSIPPGF